MLEEGGAGAAETLGILLLFVTVVGFDVNGSLLVIAELLIIDTEGGEGVDKSVFETVSRTAIGDRSGSFSGFFESNEAESCYISGRKSQIYLRRGIK